MSGASVAVGIWGGGGGEVGYGGYRLPFTVVQWQELEHQAMIYKYLVAGLPLPPDLVVAIQRSFEARFYNHPSLSYCSYYGKKFDPEPGRCRRTDGKKWRCAKDAHPDSKYCERHMHRGRNRSRKPVESQNKTPQSLSAAVTVPGSRNSGSFQNMPLYSSISSESSPYGSSVTKLQTKPISYGMDSNKEFRHIQGLTLDTDDHSFSPEASGLGLSCNAGSGTWRLMPSQVSSTKPDSQFLGPGPSSAQQTMAHSFKAINAFVPRQIKQEQHEVHPFFSEWPTTKELWSTLYDYNGSNKNVFSTQLSISIPRASSDFSSGSGYSPNGA